MLEKIKEVLVQAINVDESAVTPQASLSEDLDIDSLSAVELALELENTFDIQIEDEELVVMCSDGIIDSSEEFTNKELWLKFLLEEMQTTDAQKIADIILKEAIDYDYGQEKDDMTVIVAKVC